MYIEACDGYPAQKTVMTAMKVSMLRSYSEMKFAQRLRPMAPTNFGNDDHNKGESRQKNSSLVQCISMYIEKPVLYHYTVKLLIQSSSSSSIFA